MSDIFLAVDGKSLNGQSTIDKTRLEDGSLKVVTKTEGEDNQKQAQFKYTYVIAPKRFSISKEVQYMDRRPGLKEAPTSGQDDQT